MEKSLESVIIRYNEIGQFLKLPIEDIYTEIKIKKEPFKLNYISKQRRQTIVSAISNVSECVQYYFKLSIHV